MSDKFGEGRDRLRVGDGDVVEPGKAWHQRAQARRPDQHPDQDEADDRADPEARERRDDQSGRTQDDQRIAERGIVDCDRHDRYLPDPIALVSLVGTFRARWSCRSRNGNGPGA